MNITGASWFRRTRQTITGVSVWFERIGLVAIAAMGLATLIDVIGSKVLHRPLPGSTEITAVIQVIAIAAGLAFSKLDGRHIRVDFVFGWVSERARGALDLFSALLGLGLFAAAGWMMYDNGQSLLASGTKTFLLGIPLAPFSFWVALCCVPMCCVIIVELLTSLERMLK
jgi:TRAP-type transport system small permease protein